MDIQRNTPTPATLTIGHQKEETIQENLKKCQQRNFAQNKKLHGRGKKEKRQSEFFATKREAKKEKHQKQLEYATERKTLIIMKHGLRTLNFASLVPDSMSEKEMQQG